MHILTETEEKDLLKNRLARITRQVYGIIKEKQMNPQIHPFLVRAFLLAENYNAYEHIPFEDIEREQNDLVELNKIIRNYHQKIRIYDEDINRIVRKGLKIRKSYQPKYPSFFDKKDRIYLRISPVSSGVLYLKGLITDINKTFPIDEKLFVAEKGTSILIQTKRDRNCTKDIIGIKAGRFLKKQADYASKILAKFYFHSEKIDEYIRFINSVRSYQDYFNSYKKFQSRSSVSLPRALLTGPLFYALKAEGEITSFFDLKTRLEGIRSFYLKHYQNFHLMQAVHEGNKQASETIDLLVLSKNPFDIAKMSAYAEYSKTEWGSCMVPDGLNAYYLPDEIGKGVFVVFGVNSKNPSKKLARISVKPYLNEQGDVYYGSGYMYGLMMPKVKEALDMFLSKYQPQKLGGAFSLAEGVYEDATTKTYYFNMDAVDIIKHQDLNYSDCLDGRIGVGNWKRKKYQIISEEFLPLIFDARPKLTISADGVDKDTTFSNIDVFGVFRCYYLTKGQIGVLPHHADELELISSNIHNFKGINARYFGLNMHLSDNLKSLDGLCEYCSDVSFTRMNLETSFFKTPRQVKNLKCALVTFNLDQLDLSDISGSIEMGESDLRGIKSITLPKQAEKVEISFCQLPQQISFDISGVTDFYLGSLNNIFIKELKLSEKTKSLFLFNANFEETEVLDLSDLKKVSLVKVSLEKVSKLILPDEKSVKIDETCKMPYGMNIEMVIKNNGYGLTKTEQVALRHKLTSSNMVRQSFYPQGHSNGRCC